jgi:hypothetical protein
MGSKYLEYISRIRNAATDRKIINETEYSINIQQEIEQCTIYISGDCPITGYQGKLKGNLHAGQGVLSGSSPLRSDGLRDSQAGRLSLMCGGHKQLKGGNQTRIHLDQMVLVMARQKG